MRGDLSRPPQYDINMNLDEINKNWTALGSADPMWAILADPSKIGNQWSQEEFFESGRQDIRAILERLKSVGLPVSFGRALDFGCGIGRLTQALAEKFELVDGVDISDSMISHAIKLNQFPDRASYHLNKRGDLSLFASNQYDFIFTLICLQHMPRSLQRAYISEFIHLLKPGSGVLYFQTIHGHGWRAYLPDWSTDLYRKFKYKGQPHIPLYGIPVEEVREQVRRAGAKVEKYECPGFHDNKSRFKQDEYFVKKPASPGA
jgi:SAM-dependent methyltransferase